MLTTAHSLLSGEYWVLGTWFSFLTRFLERRSSKINHESPLWRNGLVSLNFEWNEHTQMMAIVTTICTCDESIHASWGLYTLSHFISRSTLVTEVQLLDPFNRKENRNTEYLVKQPSTWERGRVRIWTIVWSDLEPLFNLSINYEAALSLVW